MLRLLRRLAALLIALAMLQSRGQQVLLSGLRAVNGMGTFHGLRQDAAGNLYTLLEAHDGVRLLKFNAAGTQLVGQVQVGQLGDSGIALDLDAAGNVFVAGTSDSRGSLTGTSGTAFPNKSGTRTNSFVAKFSPALTQQWLTFCGAEPMSATGITVTGNSVIVTGSIYSVGDPNNALPVTSNGIQQSPAPNSTGNGFVENFATGTGSLTYATYLTGANGDTTPAAIAADANGDAYIVGTTTASGYPTTSALVPVFRSVNGGNTSGFVTELTPAGDGFLFSTFVPGNGLNSVALDTSGPGALLLSGDIAPGLFPLTYVQTPIAPLLAYQTAVRMALDGSSVLSSTLLAPATESVIAAGPNGTAWIFSSNQSSLPVPLLPVLPLETLGNAFAMRVSSSGAVDRVARFGGLPTTNSAFASLPAIEGGILAEADGTSALSGGISPTLSSSLLSTETYDLPLAFAPNAALPNTVRDALPSASCSGSACSGGAGLLARLDPNGTGPTLALSADDLPNVTLRNLGTSTANSVQIAASGYTVSSGCATSLSAGAECSLALSGSGPGSISVQASNAASFTTTLPATTRTPNAIAVLPRELDFGIVTSGSGGVSRVLTVTNLSGATQTLASQNTATGSTTKPVSTPYTLTQTATTCTPATDGVSLVLGPGGTCTITLALAASTASSNDGPINAHWQVGGSDILLTGYGQAASESLSAATVDFGRQFAGGLRALRYLYLSNSSTTAQAHAAVATSNAAFTVTDECPTTLEAHAVCRISLAYQALGAPSSDAMSFSVDGMTANVLGETLPQPSITAASVNPNLSVTPTSITFTTPVAATSASSESHAVTVSNTGAAPFALTLGITGDFAYQTGCPATLNGGASCTVVLTFTPTGSGSRQGLLSVSAGSSAPVYVELSGTGTAILPATGAGLSFGDVPLNTPSVQWLKVSQSFATLQVASSDPNFHVVLVEDTGYGHGDPTEGAFTASTSGSCLNCWLGIQFLTVTTGAHTGAVSLTSPGGGKAEPLEMSGNGIALTGLVLTPVSQDFGPVPVHSTSASTVFQLANGTSATVTSTGDATTGDFAVATDTTGGASCASTPLAPGASCFVPVRFAPSATGTRTGALTVTTSAGQVTSALTGSGSDDPGVSFTPGELRFDNVPGGSAQQQTITVTNTGSAAATVGTPVSSDSHFTVSSGCSTLTPGATCTFTVTYAATNASAGGTLTIPVTTAPAGVPGTSNYAIAVSGLYTTESAGLQIIPGEHTTVNFGASPTGTPALSRVLHVNNLTAKALSITVDAPRQFVVTASTCATLAPNGSCDLTVQYTPQTGGDVTGTILVQGTPSDGSAVQSGLAYMEGYGQGDAGGAASLAITGSISPFGVVSFGQVPSGGKASQTLTLTNPVASPTGSVLTVRRVSTDFPYAATTNCGAPLSPGQSCTVTVTYSPLYQAQTNSGQTSAQTNDATLTIESDGAAAPQFIDLNGTATPAFVATPNNTAPVAAITTSAGSLLFNSTAVGTASAPQSVILTNTGTATVHVGSLIASAGFTASAGNCATLVSGATCQVAISFVPQTAGVTLGSVEIQSDASVALEFVTLLGTVAAPTGPVASAGLTPQSLDFGRVLVGKIATLNATFTNTGALPVTLGADGVMGDSSFSLAASSSATNVCGAAGTVIAPGASCTIAVLFAPGTTGTLRGTLSVASSATTQPLTVALSGVGTQPQLSVSPTALNFGSVAVGSTSTLSLTLINTSNSPVDGLAFSTTSGYSVTSTCGITTLNANSSCAVSVTFAPSASGVTSGALTISSTDPAAPLSVPLSGAGLVAAAASQTQLSSTPSALSFGNVAVGSRGTLALTLSNPTGVPANGLLFAVTAGYSVSNGCNGSLNAYSTCPVVVSFAPATAGLDTGTLTIQNSASTTPLTVSLTGTGTTLAPQLTLTPASLNLGSVASGGSSTGTLTLTNTSSTPVNNITFTATAGFAYSGGCATTLNANSSCAVLVAFAPVSTGTLTGSLTVTSSDPASPLTAALSGSSVQSGSFTLAVDGGSTSSVTVQSGLPATYALLVTPNGGYTGVVDLTCSADTPVQYAACSLVPPSVTLSSSASQSSFATISTVSASNTNPAASLRLHNKPLWCLSPALLVLLLRRKRPAALLLLLCGLAFTITGCGGGGDSRIRYVAPGTYTFHVTATSTNSTPVSQTVTLTLVVTPKP